MIRGARSEGPVKEALGRLNGQIVDARIAMMHEASGVEFPVFVAIRAIPLSGIVVRFVGETHSNSRAVESPKLLDQAVLQLAIPFARQELNDFLAAVDEFRAIAPAAVHRVDQRDLLRVARIPAVFGFPYFLRGCFTREGWDQTDLGLASHFVPPLFVIELEIGRGRRTELKAATRLDE